MALTLNNNPVLLTTTNMIANIQVVDLTTATPTIAQKLRTSATMFGDQYVKRTITDMGGVDVFDPNADSSILKQARNKSIVEETVTADVMKQIKITTDNFISSFANMNEGMLADINGQLISTVNGRRSIDENSRVNVYIGTFERTGDGSAGQNVEIDISDLKAPTTTEEQKAYNELVAQRTVVTLRKIYRDLADNNTQFTTYGTIRNFQPSDTMCVWNGDVKDQLLYAGMSTIFNDELLTDILKGDEMAGKYFGKVYTASGTSKAGDRFYVNKTVGNKFYFAGQAVPVGTAFSAGEVYAEDTSKDIVCKILIPEGNPNIIAGERATMYEDPSQHYITNYLTYVENKMYSFKGYPFITVKFKRA